MTSKSKIVLDPVTEKNVHLWLDGAYDASTKAAIKKLLDENPKEIVDSFYTNLAFGTGGLRGIMGVGCNRMNVYTVRAATQGLANYINRQPKTAEGFSVLIGYDSRNHSREFAEESAKVLAANNIKVYLFKELRPTPLVSFGCRFKKCNAAIMITASHNPPEYNGYKVYWNDGAQVLPPHDKNIIDEVQKIVDPKQVKEVGDLKNPLIEEILEEVDAAYIKAIHPLQLYPEINRAEGNTLKVVYTSLHGTGITMVPRTLDDWGFTNYHFVDPQVIADGNFPTVKSPNPEEKTALSMGIDKVIQTGADLLIATDPDADRVGVAIKHNGEIILLNGNQMAAILLEHVCEALTKQKRLPEKAAFVKTIGTTELFQAICNTYKRPCINVLTGFKYIAEKIREWEKDPKEGLQYIFGGEESYGYLLGTKARDKDAVISAALICEVALQAKKKGKTLLDLLHELYAKHGFFLEKLLSVEFEETKEGKDKMAAGMNRILKDPPKHLAGKAVAAIEDYRTSIRTDLKTGATEKITLPKSNVLFFWLEDGSKAMIRPSGTEPKIKIYCGVVQKDYKTLEEASASAETYANALLQDLKGHLSSN